MIYALGLMSDGTFARFTEQAATRGIDVVVVDLRDALDGEWVFPVGCGGAAQLHLPERSLDLQPDGGFFCRIINLASTESDPQRARRWQAPACRTAPMRRLREVRPAARDRRR